MTETLLLILRKTNDEGEHVDTFVFLYACYRERDLVRHFGQLAADPEINFSWYDAAQLCQRIRDVKREREQQANLD